MATPTSSPHFDLTSMLNLQKNYAADLTKIPVDPTTNTGNSNAIMNLNTKLNSLYGSINMSQANSNAVLYKQKIVNDIIETERRRLEAKKANIDTAITGQKRMIALNNNYQKRYAAYTKIAIAVVVGMVLYIFMDKLKILLPFIPGAVFYTLIVIILGTIIIYIYLTWLDIQRREKMNFDEVSIPRPDISELENKAGDNSAAGGPGGASGAGNIKGAVKGPSGNIDFTDCVGQECCGLDQNTMEPIPWSPITGCAIIARDQSATDTLFSS